MMLLQSLLFTALLAFQNTNVANALPEGLPPRATSGAEACDDGATTGYNRYSAIRFSINSGQQDKEATFVLCPGFYWDLHAAGVSDSTLNVYDGMAVICGEDGKSSNNCTFAKSTDHVFVQDADGTDMILMGIQFVDAWSMSIRTSINKDSSNTLTFIDCHWKNNRGTYFNLVRSTVFVYMHVLLKHCTFESNDPSKDVITVQPSGKVSLESCVFKGNAAARTIIAVEQGGALSATKTCFIENEGETAYGTVAFLLEDGLEKAENTFLMGNNMEIGCSDGFSLVTSAESTCYAVSTASACLAENVNGDLFLDMPTPIPSENTTTTDGGLPSSSFNKFMSMGSIAAASLQVFWLL